MEHRREEYAARINRVMGHVHGHLAEPLTRRERAAVACFSPFQFHRVFAAVTDIALDCGFSSSASLARAFEVRFGVAAPEGTRAEGAVGIMDVPGGTCAIARFELGPDQYAEAWRAVFGGWLPSSGFQPDDRPAFELHHDDPKDHPEGEQIVDICVPVRPL